MNSRNHGETGAEPSERSSSRARTEDPSADPTELLDQLDAAREKATPGPWTAATAPAEGDDRSHAEYLIESLRPDEGRPLWVTWAPAADVHAGEELAYVIPVVTGDGPTSRDNAAFVALAHAAMPALTSALRAVLALADELDAEVAAQHARGSLTFHGLGAAAAARRIRTTVASALAHPTNQEGATR